MPAPTKPASLPTAGDAWADMSDDAEAEEASTVHVDSLDLTGLSIGDKNEGKSTTSTEQKPPGKSLADRISMGGDEKPTGERGDEVVKASSSTTATKPTSTATSDKSPQEEKEAKAEDTNLVQNRYEVAVKLQDLQADPNSPLYSVKSFEELGLHPNLLKGIYAMKFQKPSKVQERALPLLVSNPPRNMIGQSQSGTGKTAAFVLTMLSRINYDKNAVQAVCLAPTRELARQIVDVIKEMGKFTPVKVTLAIKDGLQKGEVIRDHVVVGTPGTVMDLLRRRALDAKSVNVFVLDEADNMLDLQGMGEQSLRIKNFMPKNAQVLLFSATFPDQVRAFAQRFSPNANEITLKTEELSIEGIKQLYLDCRDEQHKYEVLVGLYGVMNIGQSIIFVARRDTADEIARRMTEDGHIVTVLHGARDAAERDAVMDSFRSGKSKVLITTNVLARGIDINQVNMVINYDLPVDVRGNPDFETYLHRIGRTGRFGRTGVSIAFIHDQKSWKELDGFQRYFGVEMVKIPTRDWEETEEMIKAALRAK